MPVDEILLDAEERMEKAVNFFNDKLRAIRTGRANAGLVEFLRVNAYGSQMELRQVANIGTPEPNLIVIRPFDPSTLKDIEKALQASDIGLNPQNDGKVIRLVIPPLSEERREKLVSQVKSMAEDTRVAIRNIRRDANKALDKEEKASDISEDDCEAGKEEIQELTNQYEEKVDKLVDKKTEDIMQV